jgi:voltage-dependent calcium channel L type alpha-1D
MIFSIAGNSILLAITDYTDDTNSSSYNQTLDKIDKGFTVIFIAEALIKVSAHGFVIHKKSYLRNPWNVLDFTVVLIGVISLIPNVPNLKSLRTLRVLRPLRSINAVPSMKRLVQTLLLSIPRMGYLVSFLLFFIFVFAILGVQLFKRDLYLRCRLTDSPVNGTWPYDESQKAICGGNYHCRTGTFCHELFEAGIPLSQDHVETWDFIQYGYLNFDNIGTASLQVFRVITLEGWTQVMYNFLDSSGFIAAIYFPMVVVLGSFFLLNLFLAVIMQTFSETSEA